MAPHEPDLFRPPYPPVRRAPQPRQRRVRECPFGWIEGPAGSPASAGSPGDRSALEGSIVTDFHLVTEIDAPRLEEQCQSAHYTDDDQRNQEYHPKPPPIIKRRY